MLFLSEIRLRRKNRFLFGVFIVTALLGLPMMAVASFKLFQLLALLLVFYFVDVYLVYRMTIRNIRPKYPMVSPEGQAYTGRMPRPIYEDMEQYPWFFKKKRKKNIDKKKVKKR